MPQLCTSFRNKLPGLQYNFSQYIKNNMDEAIAGVKGEVAVKLFGPDLNKLTQVGNQITGIIEKVPGMEDVACDQLPGQPQLVAGIDRERAARYGINTSDILDVVETSVGGKTATQVIEGERRFDLILRYKSAYRADTGELSNIQLPSPSKAGILLAQVAVIREEHGASTILRDKNAQRIAIKANVRKRDLMSAVSEARTLLSRQVKIPEGYSIFWGGQSERAKNAMGRLLVVMPLTLVLISFLALRSNRCCQNRSACYADGASVFAWCDYGFVLDSHPLQYFCRSRINSIKDAEMVEDALATEALRKLRKKEFGE